MVPILIITVILMSMSMVSSEAGFERSQPEYNREFAQPEEKLPVANGVVGGFWKKHVEWKPRWVQEWRQAKVWKSVWKKVWGPVHINEWLPIPRKQPPGWDSNNH